MEIQIKTTYDSKAMTDLTRVVKSLRAGKEKFVRFLGWLLVVLGIVMGPGVCLVGMKPWSQFNWMAPVISVVLFFILRNDEKFNASSAWRNIPVKQRENVTTFGEEEFVAVTQAGETHWPYKKIYRMFETEDYFILLQNKNGGQVFDKKGFEKGSPAKFKTFMEEKTGKTVEYFK